MRKLGVLLTALLLVTSFAPRAEAQAPDPKSEASKRFAKGFAYYQNGEYLKAVVELKAAYQLRPVPVVMFYIGKTFQAAGLIDEAARAYWRFLDEATLNDPKRKEAEDALKEMKKPARDTPGGVTDPGTPPGPGTGPTVDPPRDRPRVDTPDPPRRRATVVKPGEIVHEAVEDARPGRPMVLEAELPEDFGDWARLYLYYRPKGQEAFLKKMMKADRRGIYSGCISKRYMTGGSVQYYIEALGRTGKRQAGSGTSSSPNIVSLSATAPLQSGGRLAECPDEAGAAPAGEDPRRRPGGDGVTPPGGDEKPRVGSRKLKLLAFGASLAAVAITVGAGVGMAVQARSKAQEMANAGVNGPSIVFDDAVERIQKNGKALDTGAIVCYVLAGIAAGGAGYLTWDLFFKGKKKRKAEESESVTDSLRITPSIGPQSFGVTGGFQF